MLILNMNEFIFYQQFFPIILQWFISVVILYLNSKFVGLNNIYLNIISSTIVLTINWVLSLLMNIHIDFILSFLIWWFILKLIYKSSWSRAFVLTLFIWFTSSIIRLLIPVIPTPL